MKNEKILFCDIDDVLIKSSDFIQKYVNENTVFKTDMLNIIEQQKRNCQYYYGKVKEECERAFVEKRIPNLSLFPNMEVFMIGDVSFDSLSSGQMKKLYKEPVAKAYSYLEVANSIMDQFLEQRDMFLELDNLPFGGVKGYDYAAEKAKVEEFKNNLRNNKNDIKKINEYCISEAEKISNEARSKYAKPMYGDLVKMDNNDIIRTDANDDDFIDTVYLKPCNEVRSCLLNSPVDYAIENLNIEKRMSHEIVDYDFIYREDHVNKAAVFAIENVIASKHFDRVCFITHHNGEREEKSKRRLMQKLFPGTDFLGLRFHSEEHNLGRRKRSSKFDKAYSAYNIDKNNMLLLDDSRDNCNDWFEKGGSVILYRRVTPAEKINGLEVFPYYRITDFDYLINRIEKNVNNEKTKRLEKKRYG